MVQRERRVSNVPFTGKNRRRKLSPFLRLLKRYRSMCRKATLCPEFERRTKEGITSACSNCEYIKQEKKMVRNWRIATGVFFLAFVILTYVIY